MPWKCELVEVNAGREYPDVVRIGSMWFAPWYLTLDHHRRYIGTKYFERWAAKRPPVVVYLPGNIAFCVDDAARQNGKIISAGWNVAGDAPLITVHPSINIGGIYHGYITNGIIGDDTEGRKYDENGRQI